VWRWTPEFNGRKLDDITDYLNYVFIPVYFIYRFGLGSAALLPALGLVLLASAFGFCHEAAKTDDGYFTGFPSYWNVVAFYLYLLKLPSMLAGVILTVLALMVFVPIKYLYPSKTPVFKRLNIGLGVVWAVMCTGMLIDLENVSPTLVWASLFYPVYYMGLSFYLHWRGGVAQPTERGGR